MKYGREKHHRRSIRLKGYDYTQPGAYFVTLVTQDRACLFGDVVVAQMRLNDAGRMVERCWLGIPDHFPHVGLDVFVVMPNHIHGILLMTHAVGAKHFSPLPPSPRPRGTSKTIGSVVRGFKTGVTKWFRQNTDVYTVWQRNYYEHVIRDEASLNRIREYIANNPLQWALDRENPNVGARHAVPPPKDEPWAV